MPWKPLTDMSRAELEAHVELLRDVVERLAARIPPHAEIPQVPPDERDTRSFTEAQEWRDIQDAAAVRILMDEWEVVESAVEMTADARSYLDGL